jgi:hypothetical protein
VFALWPFPGDPREKFCASGHSPRQVGAGMVSSGSQLGCVLRRTIADRSGILPVVGRILARGPHRTAVATIVPRTFQPDADIAPFAVLAVAWTSLPEARDHCSDVPAEGLDSARPVTVGFSPHLPRIEQPGYQIS